MKLDLKRMAISTLAAGVVMWLLAGLWHSVIAAAFYTEETGADHEGTGLIFAAYLILAALMAFLYPSTRGDRHPAIDGLRFGAVIGLLWVFPHELAMAGAHGDPLAYVFQNAAWHMVEQGVGGVVLGVVFGRRPS